MLRPIMHKRSFQPARSSALAALLLTLAAGSACSRQTHTGTQTPSTGQQGHIDQAGAPGVVILAPEAQPGSHAVSSPETGTDGVEDQTKQPDQVAAPPEVGDSIASGTNDVERELDQRAQRQLAEILELYRRLHIELDDAGRSKLIVELFHDPRLPVRLLGFELADRDLSGSTVLSPEVGIAVKEMLGDPSARIRSKGARLLARLVPPDAMIVLTEALGKETDPVAADPMLMGIARWPNADAAGSVMRWFLRDDAPLPAACTAMWAFEQAGLIDDQADRRAILDRLRAVDPASLREAGMKLLARFGEAADLRVLTGLMLNGTPNTQLWAANALVETPRGVEVLVQVAEENTALFGAAADALIRHRSTPEGLRRLAQLPAPDAQTRREAIVRMGGAIEPERLTEAVRLADLEPDLAITLLSGLLKGTAPISSRTAKGVVLLAELELGASRPNRALEATLAIDGVEIDPLDRGKANAIKATALILLGRFDEAYEISASFPLWRDAVGKIADQELRIRAAQFVLDHAGKALTEEQVGAIQLYLKPAKPLAQPPSQG